MLIPNASQAIVDIRKLRDYCLNPIHPQGKHKARLFQARLGIQASDAESLRQILLVGATLHAAELGRSDQYGQRYSLKFTIEWQAKSATLCSGWIIETGSDRPKLITCYLL